MGIKSLGCFFFLMVSVPAMACKVTPTPIKLVNSTFSQNTSISVSAHCGGSVQIENGAHKYKISFDNEKKMLCLTADEKNPLKHCQASQDKTSVLPLVQENQIVGKILIRKEGISISETNAGGRSLKISAVPNTSLTEIKWKVDSYISQNKQSGRLQFDSDYKANCDFEQTKARTSAFLSLEGLAFQADKSNRCGPMSFVTTQFSKPELLANTERTVAKRAE